LLGWWDWPAFDPRRFYNRDYFQSTEAPKGYDNYASMTHAAGITARARLSRIERLLGQSDGQRRLLEIGCGPGEFLDVAADADWKVRGVEVSPYAAGEAQRRGHDVSCAAAEAFSCSGSTYDCVALWDVIEHVRQPATLLAHCANSLSPGGVLALSTGDVTSLCARLSGASWHLFNLPEHLFFFSPRSLELMLSRAGLRVTRVCREINWVPASYVFERICKTLGVARPAARWEHWAIPATLLDVVGVYALRRSGERPSCRAAPGGI